MAPLARRTLHAWRTIERVLPSLAALALACSCGGSEDASPEPARSSAASRDAAEHAASEHAAGIAEDPRLAPLLGGCTRDTTYDVDTSDIEPILVEAVLHGGQDALHAAKRELAAGGPAGIDAARRILLRFWNDPGAVGAMRNALEIVALSDDPAAHALALEALGHPLEALRLVALEALGKHGRKEDYGAVRAALDLASPEFRARFLVLLDRLDPARAEDEFAKWMREPERREFADFVAPTLADSVRPSTIQACRELWAAAPPSQQAWLAAPCARAGDAEALALLRRDQRAADPNVRRRAAQALSAARMLDELTWTLAEDPAPELRLFALSALSTPEVFEEHRGELAQRLSDPSELVSSAALEALAARGDPAALDRARLDLVDPRPGALELGMRALAPRLAAEPELARSVLASLAARLEHESDRPIEEETQLLQAIAQVPLEGAARLLLERARSAEGFARGIDARRWLVLRAGSVEAGGQELLAEELARERDPRRRLDLIEGIATLGNAGSREALLEFVEQEGLSPYEILLASERLVRIGPAREVAPVLKRVTLRVSQTDVRVALQCLLWSWYPAPRE